MTRTRNLNGQRIPLTDELNVKRDAEEGYENDPQREVERQEKLGNEAVKKIEVHGIDRAQFKALLDHENRLRTLEGRQPITAQQLKDWVKARL